LPVAGNLLDSHWLLEHGAAHSEEERSSSGVKRPPPRHRPTNHTFATQPSQQHKAANTKTCTLPNMQASPCPVVRAIDDAAAVGHNLAPLTALLRNPPAAWHTTPVQDPEFQNYFPLHVAIQKSCLDALNLLLINAPFESFTFTFPNGDTQTALQLAQRQLDIDCVTRVPTTASRWSIIMRLMCAHIEHQDVDPAHVPRDMNEVMDRISATDLHQRFGHFEDKTLLHVAVQKQRPNTVKWLLERGASPYVKCGRGQSALQLAEKLDEFREGGYKSLIHDHIDFCVDHPDVFISYRRGLESNIAQRMHEALSGPPFYLRVFWDNVSIPHGKEWQTYFAKCAASSALFVPLISYDGALRTIVHKTHSNDQDNMLLEHIIFYACYDKSLKICLPICIGDSSTGYPWNPFSFSPSNAVQQNPIIDAVMQLGPNRSTNAKAKELLAEIPGVLPAMLEKTDDVTAAILLQWFSGFNGVLLGERRDLAAAAAAQDPNLPQLEGAEYDQLFKKIEVTVRKVPRTRIQPRTRTQGGIITILNSSIKFFAGAALGMAALSAVCSRMNMFRVVTNVRQGSIIIHFRLVTTLESAISMRAGYDQLAEWHKDGTLERDFGLGPLRFELEDCVDDSLPMLLHQQRCNFEKFNKQSGDSLQLKPEYTSEELRVFMLPDKQELPVARAPTAASLPKPKTPAPVPAIFIDSNLKASPLPSFLVLQILC
jgi:hypothetical protein